MFATAARQSVLIGLLAALILLGATTWLMFAHSGPCAEPVCAQERFALYVEVDTFTGVPPLAAERIDRDREASPVAVLATGGVRLQLEYDQDSLPYAAESGPLDRADLMEYARVWRNRTPPGDADASLYAMLAPAIVSDAGERLFGLMFDIKGREIFAISPSQTQRTFRDQTPEEIELLQLRTFTHELLHALNRQHLDAAPLREGRLTAEAPTRCIAEHVGERWSLVERPLMAISPATIAFFQTAPARDVLPGRANTPYAQRRTSASECDELRGAPVRSPAFTRWQLLRKRLSRIAALQSAVAQGESAQQSEPRPPSSDEGELSLDVQEERPSVDLYLQAQPSAYPLGYPIAVRLRVRNESNAPLPLRDRLSPPYGLVQIERRAASEETWTPVAPLVFYEPVTDESAMLAPGDQAEETIPVYFGEDGWTFPEEGDYALRARLLTSEDEQASSNEASIRVRAPTAPADVAALQVLLDEEDRLDPSKGRLLLLGGRAGEPGELDALAAAAQAHAQTSIGAALRLIVLSHQLIPPIDPRTGERPSPDLHKARRLLQDACADSGVAARTHEVLQRFDSEHAAFTPRENNSAWAWDGVSAQHGVMPTYSDPRLRQAGPSLHFCFDAATLSDAVADRARRVAQALRRGGAERIVVVGHADHAAECSYNDTLAMQRADEVKRILIEAGLPSERIRVVSLGERRPLDFSRSRNAWLLNRRVEILVEGVDVAAAAGPALPRCPAERAVRANSAYE